MLSLVYPYYRNPTMLAAQFRVWAGYADAAKAQIEIVVVDDGSPDTEAAATVSRPDGLPPFRLYRVLEDRPWHQHGARNLGAREAAGNWLFLSDMDHVLPADSLTKLLALPDLDRVYTFARLDAPDLTPKLLHGRPHPHPNTFCLKKARYWSIGGYDEDLTGYGTDWAFRQQLGETTHLSDVPVIRYPREVIADASTRSGATDPKAFRDAARRTNECRQIVRRKQAAGLPPKVLDFPWERVA